MTWSLQVNEDKEIGLYLYCQTPLPAVPLQLYAKYVVTFSSDRVHGYSVRNTRKLHNFCRNDDGWGWERLFDFSDLSHYTDLRGSFNLKVEADFFVEFESDGVTEILPVEEKCREASEVESFKMRQEIILKQVAALLRDEVSSDVIVSVVDKQNVEIGIFLPFSRPFR